MTIYKRRKGEAYLLTNSAIPVYTILSDLSVFLIIQSSVGLIRVPVNACFHLHSCEGVDKNNTKCAHTKRRVLRYAVGTCVRHYDRK